MYRCDDVEEVVWAKTNRRVQAVKVRGPNKLSSQKIPAITLS